MSGWLSGPRDSRPLGHSAIDGGGDPFSGARVVSVAHFEPAAGMQGEALDSYKRRFGTLFMTNLRAVAVALGRSCARPMCLASSSR